MALANWDTFACDETGGFADASFKSTSGVVVEFYKNWLYVHDEKAWDDKSGWAKPTVMEIRQGVVQYKDVRVIALRGPQQGIYAVVFQGYGEETKGMIGCGVYGFTEGGEFVGVLPESREFLQIKLLQHADWQDEIPDYFRQLKCASP